MVRAKITYAAPKWRDPVTDDQVVLCRAGGVRRGWGAS